MSDNRESSPFSEQQIRPCSNLFTAEYSLFIATFFVGYFLFEVPSNLVMGKLRPSFYLPSIVTAWGAVVIGMSQAKGYEGFLIGRFFLGAIEAGLFPGAIFM